MKSGADTAAVASPIGAIAGARSGEVPAPPAQGGGRFEPLREIGRGGVGRVLAAKDGQFGRHVAVKALAKNAGDVGRVEPEATLVAPGTSLGIDPRFRSTARR